MLIVNQNYYKYKKKDKDTSKQKVEGSVPGLLAKRIAPVSYYYQQNILIIMNTP
jgi:hypothetical protein